MGQWKEYFAFTRRERNAFVILLLLITVLLVLPEFFVAEAVPPKLSAADSLALLQPLEKPPVAAHFENPKATASLFRFDPNTLDEHGFIRLGVPEKTARTIIRYREKGGRFRSADDLRKIYTLSPDIAERIIPYAFIASQANSSRNSPYSPQAIKPIDINLADQAAWKSLPGIGDILSQRIIANRQRLGGFRSIDQVATTYGLKDSVFQLIRPLLLLKEVPSPKKPSINAALVSDLLRCEGISRELALHILAYRQQNGRITELQVLANLPGMTADLLKNLSQCFQP